MSGKCRKWYFATATLFALIAAVSFLAEKEEPMAQDENDRNSIRVKIPDDAVYLGTDMGGEFVVLRRQDIRLDTGEILPAFHMEIYWAGSNGKPYGVERVGGLTYSGLGLYVPPQALIDEIGDAAHEPPSVEYILHNDGNIFNGWVNGDIFWVAAKPYSEDPDRKYIGKIVPLNLNPQ